MINLYVSSEKSDRDTPSGLHFFPILCFQKGSFMDGDCRSRGPHFSFYLPDFVNKIVSDRDRLGILHDIVKDIINKIEDNKTYKITVSTLFYDELVENGYY